MTCDLCFRLHAMYVQARLQNVIVQLYDNCVEASRGKKVASQRVQANYCMTSTFALI